MEKRKMGSRSIDRNQITSPLLKETPSSSTDDLSHCYRIKGDGGRRVGGKENEREGGLVMSCMRKDRGVDGFQ